MKRFWQRFRQLGLLRVFWEIAGGVSIRVKVLGIVIGVIVLLGTFVILQIRDLMSKTLSQNLESQGIALVTSIASDLSRYLVEGDMDTIELLLYERRMHYSSESHNTFVEYLVIEDEQAIPIIQNGNLYANGQYREVVNVQAHHEVVYVNGHTIEISSKIPNTDSTVRLGLSTLALGYTVNQVTLQLFTTTLIMIAVGFAAAFFLTWILTRPILDLVNVTHAVAKGDFSKRVQRWSNDEIGELATSFNQMTESLAQARKEREEYDHLRQQYINGVILAQENERQRIARELHDSTSQSLTSLLVGLQNLKQTEPDTNLNGYVDDLRHIVVKALDETRDISWRLRPRTLDDIGLVSAIENYVKDFENRYAITVDIVISGLGKRLMPEIETSIYRIVQEGLTNVARYAKATDVSIILTCKNNHLKLIIEDNGVGFDVEHVQKHTNSLGLQGIRERAGLFGGTLTIESGSGQGTSLFIEIPMIK